MRWAYEGVVFEPSGVDHSSPGSSFQVGGQIVGSIFGGKQPIGPMYAFVGISGMAKMSSSKGGVPTPADALKIMEPQLLRWLYARRRPNQSFKIAFDQEIQRLYDEWDKLDAKVADGSALPADIAAHSRAVRTAAGELPKTPRPMPYRTLASVADITAGHEDQTLRILSDLDPTNPLASLDEVRPRYDKAEAWINTQVPAEQRTVVREEPDVELLKSLDDQARESLRLLLDGLDSNWSLDGLTTSCTACPRSRPGSPRTPRPRNCRRRSRRPSARSSRCSTTSSSAATPGPDCPRCCSRWGRNGYASCSARKRWELVIRGRGRPTLPILRLPPRGSGRPDHVCTAAVTRCGPLSSAA